MPRPARLSLVPPALTDAARRDQIAEELAADGGMSVRQTMAFLSLGQTEIYEMCNRGDLAFCLFGRRRVISRRSVVRAMALRMRGAELG